jgi:hypothetical protein
MGPQHPVHGVVPRIHLRRGDAGGRASDDAAEHNRYNDSHSPTVDDDFNGDELDARNHNIDSQLIEHDISLDDHDRSDEHHDDDHDCSDDHHDDHVDEHDDDQQHHFDQQHDHNQQHDNSAAATSPSVAIGRRIRRGAHAHVQRGRAGRR